jgi:1,4-dihydroxy-2-naphthoyl-CoA synthase
MEMGMVNHVVDADQLEDFTYKMATRLSMAFNASLK